MLEQLHQVVGRDSDTITWWQMSIRAVVIFAYLLLLIRLGGKRAFGKITSFDIVLAMLLGSALGRALTGNSKLIPTMAAAAVLVALHSIMTTAAFHLPYVGFLIKGRRTVLVRHGKQLPKAMKRTGVTRNDLAEAARMEGLRELDEIEFAYLERNGDISIVPRDS